MTKNEKCGKVAVIGLAGQSAFMTTHHFPAPGETVSCSSLFFETGGKGYNQAVACARMGVHTVFIGAVGDDANGESCAAELKKEGIDARLIKKNAPTAYAVITTRSDGENTVAVHGGAAKALTGNDLNRSDIKNALTGCDYLLLQNELSEECLSAAFALAQKMQIPVILNPAPAERIPKELLKECALITPNFGEVKSLAGFTENDTPTEQALKHSLKTLGIKKAAVTMGGKGALLIDGEHSCMIPAFSPGKTIDTTGAGDTFSGALTAFLAKGYPLKEAAERAAVAAGISVTKKGAAGSIPAAKDVEKYLCT
ncbi:MAG: ribokinase [Clostridia bacterium]|nr:ribokinase [Clostridia bacterium]